MLILTKRNGLPQYRTIHSCVVGTQSSEGKQRREKDEIFCFERHNFPCLSFSFPFFFLKQKQAQNTGGTFNLEGTKPCSKNGKWILDCPTNKTILQLWEPFVFSDWACDIYMPIKKACILAWFSGLGLLLWCGSEAHS